MSKDVKILHFFTGSDNEFKPNYEKGNSFRRLFLVHLISALVIAPLFCLFVYQTNVPQVYFYLSASYAIFIPIYLFLALLIKPLQPYYYYFFIVYLMIMTLVSYQSLLKNDFQQQELFSFFGLYVITLYIIQKLYPAIIYNVVVLVLIIYGLEVSDNGQISKDYVVGLQLVMFLSSTFILYHRRNLLISGYDYSDYLKKIIHNPGSGYVLFNLNNEGLEVIDYDAESMRIFSESNGEVSELSSKLYSFFDTNDIRTILKLKEGKKHTKDIEYTQLNSIQHFQLITSVMNFKNGIYWICRINNISSELEKREELELSEKKYKNLYRRNKAGVFTIDSKSKIIDGNDSFFEMLEDTCVVGDILFLNNQIGEWEFILDILESKESIQSYQTQLTLKNKSQKTLIFSWYFDSLTDCIEGSVIDLTTIQKASQALKQSEEKYRLIFEESNDVILLLDNDRVVDVNRRAIQLFGKPERELLGVELFRLSYDTSKEKNKEYTAHRLKLQNMRSTKFDWIFNGNGRKIEAEVSLIEIVLGDRLFYQCVIHDTTEQKIYLRKIDQNRQNFENILENNPQGIVILRNEEMVYQNTEMKAFFEGEFSFSNLFVKEDIDRFIEQFEWHRSTGENIYIQLGIKGKRNETIPADVTLVSTNYEEQPATMMIIKDISVQNRLAKQKLRAELAEETNKKLADEIMERIRAEKQLQEQFLRTKAILDSSSNTFLLTLSLNQKVTSFNTHFESYFFQLFNKNIEYDRSFDEIFKEAFASTGLRLFRRLFNNVRKGEYFQFEVKMGDRERVVWWEIFMNPIFDTEGHVAEISLVAHDVTEKKKTDLEISESLEEKKILLKEIHHRVKNNLQVISSILNLQSSFINDEKTLGILQESRNRIRSMAIIHENLYRTEDFSSINFSNYLHNLTANLIASYRIHTEVKLEVDLKEIDMVLDQAIPCGLLVNELITNSLKYAWKANEIGTISLHLSEEDGQINLFIGDDGVGLPMEFEKMNTDTLGLQLVLTLVEQLDGELTVENKNGTKYLIKFDNAKTKQQ